MSPPFTAMSPVKTGSTIGAYVVSAVDESRYPKVEWSPQPYAESQFPMLIAVTP